MPEPVNAREMILASTTSDSIATAEGGKETTHAHTYIYMGLTRSNHGKLPGTEHTLKWYLKKCRTEHCECLYYSKGINVKNMPS